MAITIAEAQERHREAERIELESNILAQWYYALGATLAEQAQAKRDEPDFSAHWLMCPDGLLQYLRESGVECTTENWQSAVVDFVNKLVGDQLTEYGIELRPQVVHGFMESANRFYLLRPGQQPSY